MKAWHFVNEDRKMGYGDNRIIKAGRVYRVPDNQPLELCSYGLHASKRLLDALKYAPGPIVCRVELLGERLDDCDKSVAYVRRVDWMADITETLHRFARLCALDVVHLWDAPEEVIRFLKTGDKSLRAAAQAAALAAAGNSAWNAAMAAAGNSAWNAARNVQNRRLTSLVIAATRPRSRGA